MVIADACRIKVNMIVDNIFPNFDCSFLKVGGSMNPLPVIVISFNVLSFSIQACAGFASGAESGIQLIIE